MASFLNDVWATWMGHSSDINEVLRQVDWTPDGLHELFEEACERWRDQQLEKARLDGLCVGEAHVAFDEEKAEAIVALERLVAEYTSALAYELDGVIRSLSGAASASECYVHVTKHGAPVAELSYRQAWCLQGIASETPPLEQVMAEAAMQAGR